MTLPAPLLAIEGLTRHFGALAARQPASRCRGGRGAARHHRAQRGGKTTLFNVITGQLRPSAGASSSTASRSRGLPPHAVARRGHGALVPADEPLPEADRAGEPAPGRRGRRARQLQLSSAASSGCGRRSSGRAQRGRGGRPLGAARRRSRAGSPTASSASSRSASVAGDTAQAHAARRADGRHVARGDRARMTRMLEGLPRDVTHARSSSTTWTWSSLPRRPRHACSTTARC